MKRLLMALLLASSASLSSAVPGNIPPIQPRLSVLAASTSASVEVRLANESRQVIRIFNESDSWGAMNWRILRIRNGQTEVYYRSPYQAFTKNNPTFYELAPGGNRNLKLDINGGNWCSPKHCSWWDEKGLGGQTVTFEKGDQVIVIFDAPTSRESQDLKVFSGVIAGSAVVQ